MRAGIGLERRSRDLSTYWQDHFSRSRAAQARWAQTCQGNLLTVLGAGPLFDFNAAVLSTRFQRFRLVDANPLSERAWRRLNIPVEPVITDVSNCLTEWGGKLQRLHSSWEETMRWLAAVAVVPVAAYAPATDALLSLNLLSQLEVGWQELVESLLRKRFGAAFVDEHEQDWLAAIRPGAQALAEQHLAALEASRATDVLLISDVEYVEYKGREFHIQRWQPPPVRWLGSAWEAESGIAFEVEPALEGLPLNPVTLARWMPSYRLQWQESWLWHIAPLGTETLDYGTVHRVAAFALTIF